MHPKDWNNWLRSFRERFIAAKGWSEREAELRIRNAWAVVRDGQLHALTGDSQLPADAVPVFEVRTFGGWKTPIQILERLTGLVTKAMTSQRAPRDIVRGVLSQIDHSEGPDESNEVLQQRHTTALWAERLLTLCEHEAFSEVSGTDLFWNMVICALQTGRRLAFLEICRDPQVFSDLLKAQAFQSGRAHSAVQMSGLPRYEIDLLIKEKRVQVAWRPNKAGKHFPLIYAPSLWRYIESLPQTGPAEAQEAAK